MTKNPTLWIWALVLALANAYVLGWQTDNRAARWVGQAGATPGFELLNERFGGDEFVLVRTAGLEIDAPGRLKAWERESALLESLEAAGVLLDPLRLDRTMPPSERIARLTARPIVRELGLVANAGQGTYVDRVVAIRPQASPAARSAVTAIVEELRASAEERGEVLQCAGHPLVATALDQEARRVELVFVPLLVLAAALAVALFLRSPWLAVAALLPAGSASIGARAALRLAGIDSDLILVAVGPVAFVLVLAAAMHPLVAFQRYRRAGLVPSAAWAAARFEKLRPAIAAALTTAAGFGVFLASGLSSVALFGGTIAATVTLAVPLTFLGLGALLGDDRAGLGEPLPTARRRRVPWSRWARRVVRGRFVVLVALTATLSFGAFSFAGLRSETNPLGYFPRGHRLATDFASLEASGTPLSTVDVLARQAGGAPFGLDTLASEDLGASLALDPDVASAFGPAVVAADLGAADAGMGGVAGMLALPAALRASERIGNRGKVARWTVRIPSVESGPTQAIVRRVEERARRWGDQNGAQIFVAGSVPAMLAMQDLLIGTLVRSILLTALVSAAFFIFVTHDPGELLAAFLANFSPLAVVAICAGLADVPLDGATVMVAACVLGLAVDNTLHLLVAARRHDEPLTKGRSPSTRPRLRAFDAVGTAALVSSASLALGFGALAFSGFAPTARFGALAAVGCAAAFASDLIVLPALWVRRTRP